MPVEARVDTQQVAVAYWTSTAGADRRRQGPAAADCRRRRCRPRGLHRTINTAARLLCIANTTTHKTRHPFAFILSPILCGNVGGIPSTDLHHRVTKETDRKHYRLHRRTMKERQLISNNSLTSMHCIRYTRSSLQSNLGLTGVERQN